MQSKRATVIGGGIIGLSIADALSRNGFQTTVLERGGFTREASWAGCGYLELRGSVDYGDDFFHLCKSSFDYYAEWTERIHQDSGIDPEFLCSTSYDLAFSNNDVVKIQRIEEKLSNYGISGEWLVGNELRKRAPSLSEDITRAFLLEHSCQVRPPRLNNGLLSALRSYGTELVEQAEVYDLEIGNGSVQKIVTTRGAYECDFVVFAAGAWTPLLTKLLKFHLPVKPVRGQALLLDDCANRLKPILFGEGWYIVPRLDGKVYIGSTLENAGFEKAVTPAGMNKLTEAAYRAVPAYATLPEAGRWSGLRPGSHDDLPYIGFLPGFQNALIASGHFTHGILLAPVTGRIISQLIMEEKTDVQISSFSPERICAQ